LVRRGRNRGCRTAGRLRGVRNGPVLVAVLGMEDGRLVLDFNFAPGLLV
jgi:hypothetical protein